MASLEQNHEEWERIRTRADSLANAVFLIAGGALSLSISIMVSAKSSGVVSEDASAEATTGWYYLLVAIVLFVVLKFHMIGQAFLLHAKTEFADKYNKWLNRLGWAWGFAGFGTFVLGLATLVSAASMVVNN
jgi:hypothetical protein